ncbi:hypothetical protein VPH35_091051 [Triticum aestivum]
MILLSHQITIASHAFPELLPLGGGREKYMILLSHQITITLHAFLNFSGGGVVACGGQQTVRTETGLPIVFLSLGARSLIGDWKLSSSSEILSLLQHSATHRLKLSSPSATRHPWWQLHVSCQGLQEILHFFFAMYWCQEILHFFFAMYWCQDLPRSEGYEDQPLHLSDRYPSGVVKNHK